MQFGGRVVEGGQLGFAQDLLSFRASRTSRWTEPTWSWIHRKEVVLVQKGGFLAPCLVKTHAAAVTITAKLRVSLGCRRSLGEAGWEKWKGNVVLGVGGCLLGPVPHLLGTLGCPNCHLQASRSFRSPGLVFGPLLTRILPPSPPAPAPLRRWGVWLASLGPLREEPQAREEPGLWFLEDSSSPGRRKRWGMGWRTAAPPWLSTLLGWRRWAWAPKVLCHPGEGNVGGLYYRVCHIW